MSVGDFPRLVGDIGGTHARWAYQTEAGGALSQVRGYQCADFPTLEAVIEHYLLSHGLQRPRELAMGVATPVTGDSVRFVNNPWSFSIATLRESLGLQRLLVLNDFAALALSLPLLSNAGRQSLGGGSPVEGAPMVVLGPGTGLGVAGLVIQPDGRPCVISGEGGHATVAPATERECEVLRLLRREFGHVSAERVLSGPGLVNLYRAVCTLDARPPADLSPADVTGRASHDPACAQAIELFLAFLGGVAGNLALSFGALGGVYIGGGIVPRFGGLLDAAVFRHQFEDKGRLRGYVERIPTWLITADNPSLLGAANALNA
ncbi:glucokinase [Paucibacter sp. M5-1]|uniref:glucokinase n=1 Tax=Paucibacter sp. M5-1 TaxID=3015998 RepID=UPI0022B8C75E|nr:glucokinase [Paucibacter sp. M5-1]MCZ7883011.1 glucokinase [Paucibacter sp. M5-1]